MTKFLVWPLFLTILMACQSEEPGIKEVEEEITHYRIPKDAIDRQIISTERIEYRRLELIIPAPGDIQSDPTNIAMVSSMVNGLIHTIVVRDGQQVSKGEVLATLKSKEAIETISQFLETSSLLEKVTRDFTRQQSLFEASLVSEADYINTETEYKTLKNRVKSLSTQLSYFGIDPNSVLSSGDNIQTAVPVIAPISGLIATRHVVIGESVQEGKTLFTIVNNNELTVNISIFEQDFGDIQVGDTVKIMIPVLSDYLKSTLHFISPMVDEVTHSIMARAKIKNIDNRIKPNMRVKAEIIHHTEPVIAVHNEAIMLDGDQPFVFKMSPDSLFERIDVKLGRGGFNHTEVLDGLKEGDIGVINGAFILKSLSRLSEIEE